MTRSKSDLRDLARLFLRLGLTAFGGPAAHIAMMQKEVVDRRGWMDHDHFLDLIGATNLIPGPNSTEMAIHIGHERGGWKGLLVAGCCFILPAVVITGFIAWLYQVYGQLPEVKAFIYGIKPAIIAVILGAAFPLAKRAFKTVELWVIGAWVLTLSLLGFDEIQVMFGAGLVSLIYYRMTRTPAGSAPVTKPPAGGGGGGAQPGKDERIGSPEEGKAGRKNSYLPPLLQVTAGTAISHARIFFAFLKIGAILYGSGYVLFAFLDRELVSKGLLSRQQLIDAIAVGQFTPGPVFSSVTFIGWQMEGLKGAALATLAIFLPSFVFVALLNPLVPRMRRSRLFSAFLDGVNVASVAIILTVCVTFGKETVTDWRTILIALVSLAMTFGYRQINSAYIIVGGSLLGYILHFIR
jgi:chromate transporter